MRSPALIKWCCSRHCLDDTGQPHARPERWFPSPSLGGLGAWPPAPLSRGASLCRHALTAAPGTQTAGSRSRRAGSWRTREQLARVRGRWGGVWRQGRATALCVLFPSVQAAQQEDSDRGCSEDAWSRSSWALLSHSCFYHWLAGGGHFSATGLLSLSASSACVSILGLRSVLVAEGSVGSVGSRGGRGRPERSLAVTLALWRRLGRADLEVIRSTCQPRQELVAQPYWLHAPPVYSAVDLLGLFNHANNCGDFVVVNTKLKRHSAAKAAIWRIKRQEGGYRGFSFLVYNAYRLFYTLPLLPAEADTSSLSVFFSVLSPIPKQSLGSEMSCCHICQC